MITPGVTRESRSAHMESLVGNPSVVSMKSRAERIPGEMGGCTGTNLFRAPDETRIIEQVESLDSETFQVRRLWPESLATFLVVIVVPHSLYIRHQYGICRCQRSRIR